MVNNDEFLIKSDYIYSSDYTNLKLPSLIIYSLTDPIYLKKSSSIPRNITQSSSKSGI